MDNAKEKNKKVVFITVIILTFIIIDQITKFLICYLVQNQILEVIQGFLKFTYTENTGGAYGVGGNSLLGFIVVNVVVLGIILKFMISQNEQIDKKTMFVLCLVLAGGISNLIDRIIRGFVVDFIDITEFLKFPIFNLADIYIVMGWILLALFLAIYTSKEIRRKKVG